MADGRSGLWLPRGGEARVNWPEAEAQQSGEDSFALVAANLERNQDGLRARPPDRHDRDAEERQNQQGALVCLPDYEALASTPCLGALRVQCSRQACTTAPGVFGPPADQTSGKRNQTPRHGHTAHALRCARTHKRSGAA